MSATFPSHAIAIIGMSGRFPEADDLSAFWRNIRDGRESIEALRDEDLEAAGVDARLRSSASYVRSATPLQGAELFDESFFGYSPREAQLVDPQQRVFLECAWAALEDAGYVSGTAERSIGVYAGSSLNTYLLTQLLQDPELVESAGAYQLMIGNDKDFLCTRVSYKLDLRGPSVAVQTACSTSLVAVVMACKALARRECDLALAGGVSISFPQRSGYLFQEGMILSPDGRCRPFDAAAAGTRTGSGCGVVVLKRLADALADGDTIHAVVRGAALNNDGGAKAGFTAPSIEGQLEVIATAHALAGVDPREIEFVEAHGTATPLGDPIEIAALTQAFRVSTPDVGFCHLGALKANVGHLDAAAGVAGLIKTILALKHREIPPLVNFRSPNPQLALDQSPFRASAELRAWTSAGRSRIAGVSSFGIGGTNAHVVLEEPPAVSRAPSSGAEQLLVLSAKTETALETMTQNLAAHLNLPDSGRLDDVAYTLAAGRRQFAFRRALVTSGTNKDAAEALSGDLRSLINGVHAGGQRPVCFLFSGQGSQFAGMGSGLYRAEPVYRDAVDRCVELVRKCSDIDLLSFLSKDGDRAAATPTRMAQPALFVVEYALTELWKSWGIVPTAMLGHSIGELVAAQIAGVLSLADAIKLVCARGELMQSMPPGSMAAVHAAPAAIQGILPAHVEFAAYNAPMLCTVSGPSEAIAETIQRAASLGIEVQKLQTSHAFHSGMMETAARAFLDAFDGVTLSPPRIPYVSNVTGKWIRESEATAPQYYVEHLRKPVQFESGVRTMEAGSGSILLEVGPGNALSTLARICLGAQAAERVVSTLGRIGDRASDRRSMLIAAGKLWVHGAPLRPEALFDPAKHGRVPLPTYPFERKAHVPRMRSGRPSSAAALETAGSAVRRDVDSWFHAPMWSRDDSGVESGFTVAAPVQEHWLVCGQTDLLSHAVVETLRQSGATVSIAESFADVVKISRAQSGEPLSGAIYLWSMKDDVTPIGDALGLGRLALELGSAGSQPISFLYISAGAQCVLGERIQTARSALVAGPALVAPVEMPSLRIRRIDIEAQSTATDAAACILAEVRIRDQSSIIAWRRGRRWVQELHAIELPAPPVASVPVRREGVYLVTGGLGHIGLALAECLARSGAGKIVLVSRSGDAAPAKDPGVAQALDDLRRRGVETIIETADVTSEVQMRGVVERALARGPVHGVIHSAGAEGAGKVMAARWGAAAGPVANAKVDGLYVLARLLGTVPLDFVALMSSVNAIAGSAGTVDYSGENAVLDAFVESAERPAAWRKVVSINWGPWSDGGMAVRTRAQSAFHEQSEAAMASAITRATGAEAFIRVLASGRGRVAVVSPIAASSAEDHAGAVPAARGEMSTSANEGPPVLHADGEEALEHQLAVIWRDLLGVGRISHSDDFFALGGHSLLATRMLPRIQAVFGVRLTLRDIFENSILGALGARIKQARIVTVNEQDEREELEL